MNFKDSAQQSAFRTEARAWIQANAPTHLLPALERMDFTRSVLKSGQMMQASKAWQRKKSEAGWACLHWPKEYGGRSATPIERIIWEQEEGIYGELSGLFVMGHGMCGPTLLAHASEEHKRRFLPPMAAGEEIWCQLFSEPSGGSDLAGLRTRAERRGENWVINGQKIWTSGAHLSDYGVLLTRTDPSVPKHKGLTMFFVDMRSSGVEVRPIRQASGAADFNEVYFTDVYVPDHQRLGAVGGGWTAALTTLMNERLAVGTVMPTGVPEILELCRDFPIGDERAIDNPLVRSKLAGWLVKQSGLKYTALRAISALANGREPGPENSIGKLVVGQMLQEIAAFALDLQGSAGVLADPRIAAHHAYFQAMLLRSPGVRIEGGTDEILRNIIGERVLGLPGDIRVDKSTPFNQIPLNAPRPR